MTFGRRTLLALGLTGLLVGCTEDATAPGKCPAFCPGGQLSVVDTVLNIISRDSSYVGYVVPESAGVMMAVNFGGVDARPIFSLGGVSTRIAVNTADTTTDTAQSVDSALLTLTIARRDTLATNLRINLYRMPLSIDPTTTLADLSGPFTDSLLRTVNVDSLLALPGGVDSALGDSAVYTDTTRIGVRVVMKLSAAQANYLAADSGRSAFGIRISADSLASVAFNTVTGGSGPIFSWWGTYDSSGTAVSRLFGTAVNLFNSYVSNVSAPTLDSNLIVGGVPSARSILRFTLPRNIRDSSQIVRATLTMIPVAAPVGVPSDSLLLVIYRLGTDVGAKSPIAIATIADSSLLVVAGVPIGHADTIATDITEMVRFWQADTLVPQSVMIRQAPEGGNLVSVRLYSTRSPAYRPALHVTYVPRFAFGNP